MNYPGRRLETQKQEQVSGIQKYFNPEEKTISESQSKEIVSKIQAMPTPSKAEIEKAVADITGAKTNEEAAKMITGGAETFYAAINTLKTPEEKKKVAKGLDEYLGDRRYQKRKLDM
jgi:hypothetical protein